MFDRRGNSLRYLIDCGRPLGVFWLAMGAPAVVEAAARSRPDAIVLDLQHGLFDRSTLETAIGLVPTDIPVLARVSENSAAAIGQALDAGAEGVIVPLVETGKQAAKAVSYARFPPRGVRSGGGVRPLSDFVNYVERADRDTVVMVMIETAKGLKNASAIAATEGVDMVFVGTGDLAISLGTFPDASPRHDAACSEILAACRAAWTPCGIFTINAEAAIRRRAQGYRMVVTANDMDVLASGFNRATAAFDRKETAAIEAQPPSSDPVYGTLGR
jgi:2-keto-3-deoxy-L-rhamnonate aldolase RhmA